MSEIKISVCCCQLVPINKLKPTIKVKSVIRRVLQSLRSFAIWSDPYIVAKQKTSFIYEVSKESKLLVGVNDLFQY